ncbi:hypothetical protein AAG570_006882 [Ranatra chinensis]|uniref:C2H2-type domain-containing protein n=1 Tax=Ranatra chinensis TaxID=642074 RepID=A0ABD0YVB9_9HEMI
MPRRSSSVDKVDDDLSLRGQLFALNLSPLGVDPCQGQVREGEEGHVTGILPNFACRKFVGPNRFRLFATASGGVESTTLVTSIFMHKSAIQMQAQRGPEVNKPHQCQQCLKSFSSNHQLVQHIRVHTGEKPYKCSYCERRFKQLSHVQQHTRLHTENRRGLCVVAGPVHRPGAKHVAPPPPTLAHHPLPQHPLAITHPFPRPLFPPLKPIWKSFHFVTGADNGGGAIMEEYS